MIAATNSVDTHIQAFTINVTALSEPDHVLHNDAEWDALFSQPSASFDGSDIAYKGTNFTQRTIANHVFTEGITIRAADTFSSLPSLLLIDPIEKVTIDGANFQMTGWPATHPQIIRLNNGGHYRQVKILNSVFRHGYGPSLENFDPTANYPEYAINSSSGTATTTPATRTIDWLANDVDSGYIEITNPDAVNMYVQVGSDTPPFDNNTTVEPGKSKRFNADPSVDTHYTVVTESGSAAFTATYEIGLARYLADAFGATSGVINEDFQIRNCVFTDLSNAIKSCGNLAGDVWYDSNIFDRIYQDIIAFGTDTATRILNSLNVTRNIATISFSFGSDAGNPHGDFLQLLGGLFRLLLFGGNRFYNRNVRPVAWGMQGFWLSGGANLNDGENIVDWAYSISDMVIGDNNNQFIMGSDARADFIRGFVYGLTMAPLNEGFSDARNMSINGQPNGHYYISHSLLHQINQDNSDASAVTVSDNNAFIDIGTAETDVFPNWTDRFAATSVALMDAALTPTGIYADKGHVATDNAINWSATTAAEVFNWENIPSGLGGVDQVDATAGISTEIALGQVHNRGSGLAVVAGVGTEWRSLQSDNLTVVQDWTSASGTVDHGQYVEMRRNASLIDGEKIAASLVVNGFPVANSITTFLPSWDNQGVAWFDDAGGDIGSGITNITFYGRFRPSPDVSGDYAIFGAEGNRLLLVGDDTGEACWIRVEDSDDALVLNTPEFSVPEFAAGSDFCEALWRIDWAARETTLWVNGAEVNTWAFDAPGTGTAIDNRRLQFLYRSGDVFDGDVNSLKVWKNTALGAGSTQPVATPHKEIGSDATTFNADSWLTDGPVVQN
ncbi:hypothetical protein IWQ48_003790 [Labrenzia sp. EL_13]|nr:hypothetical protein [Labrenzia sp. EL_13]